MGRKLRRVSWSHPVPFCPSQAEQERRVAQTEFDRQAEVTRLLLEGISSTHVSLDPHPPRVPRELVHTGSEHT